MPELRLSTDVDQMAGMFQPLCLRQRLLDHSQVCRTRSRGKNRQSRVSKVLEDTIIREFIHLIDEGGEKVTGAR